MSRIQKVPTVQRRRPHKAGPTVTDADLDCGEPARPTDCIEGLVTTNAREDRDIGSDFKAHLLGGPKVDNFVVQRDPDAGRVVEFGAGSRATSSLCAGGANG